MKKYWSATEDRGGVMHAPLADRLGHPILSTMPRLRALAAIFACLAIFAGGLNAAFAAHGVVSADRVTVGAPCSDCDDCDKSPCPMPMANCIQMHASSGPALMATSVELRVGAYATVRWPSPDRSLSGLSPPPDPQPPRA
jgi:hypothetical protein